MNTCPFCNAALPLGAKACSRCGEPLPHAGVEIIPAPSLLPPRAEGVFGKKFLVVFLAFAIVAGVGYLIAKSIRTSTYEEVTSGQAVHVLEIEAMGYLPPGIDGVAVAQQLDQLPALREQVEPFAKLLGDAVGIDIAEVDQFVVAARFSPLGAFAVLRTKQPFSLEDRLAGKQHKATRERGRIGYELLSGKSPINPVVFQPTPRILAAALTVQDLTEMPSERRDPKGQMHRQLSGILESAGIPTFCLAARLENWSGVREVLKLSPKAKSLSDRLVILDGTETVLVFNEIDKPLPLELAVFVKNREAALKWRELLGMEPEQPADPAVVRLRADAQVLADWRERLRVK